MSDNQQDDGLKEIEITQFYGGCLGAEMCLTPEKDTQKLKALIPKYAIPVVLLHGVMGSNLRLSKQQKGTLKTNQEFAWKPDDIKSTTGVLSILAELLGEFVNHGKIGSFSHAGRIMSSTPKERQINFDPEQVEIDPYCPEDDLKQYDKTGEADKRQSKVSDINIHPFLTNDKAKSELTGKVMTGTQKARWRGWGEVVYGKGMGYEVPLKELEHRLSNRMKDGKVTDLWMAGGKPSAKKSNDSSNAQNNADSTPKIFNQAVNQPKQDTSAWESQVNEMGIKPLGMEELLQIVGKDPQVWNNPLKNTQTEMFNHRGPAEGVVTEDDIKKLQDVFFPVHAIAYNWLQSNGKSGKETAKRIEKLIEHYNSEYTHLQCKHVIILTHSMGGLVARAVLHSEFGNLQSKVLGVFHNVMPTVGAAMTYRRMRVGTGTKGPEGIVLDRVLGMTGADVTAIMANAPATLEMLPNPIYGLQYAKSQKHSVGGFDLDLPMSLLSSLTGVSNQSGWVKVKLGCEIIGTFPEQASSEPVSSIYLQPADRWWRLINPDWVNPAQKGRMNSKGLFEIDGSRATTAKIIAAQATLNKLWTVTPKNSFGSYGANSKKDLLAYGSVTWEVVGGVLPQLATAEPSQWRLLKDSDTGNEITVSQNGTTFQLRITDNEDIGEQMVPSFSAAAVKTTRGKWVQQEYDHGGSYDFPNTLGAVLYSIVKIALEADYVSKSK